MRGRGREDAVVKFPGTPGARMKNLEYGSEVFPM